MELLHPQEIPEKKPMIIINNNNSYQDVRVGTREEKSLETASDCADVTWSGRFFHIIVSGNWERPLAD